MVDRFDCILASLGATLVCIGAVGQYSMTGTVALGVLATGITAYALFGLGMGVS